MTQHPPECPFRKFQGSHREGSKKHKSIKALDLLDLEGAFVMCILKRKSSEFLCHGTTSSGT